MIREENVDVSYQLWQFKSKGMAENVMKGIG